MDVDKEPEIDEGLYSRQLYVVGAEAMKKMSASKILLSGLGGLGCEIAKNLILTGIGSLTLHDNSSISWRDLSSHFYATDRDVGKNRVDACLNKLAELNKYVTVNQHTGDLTRDVVSQHSVVILSDACTSSTATQELDQYCHEQGIKFLSVESRGLAGCIFCDFGPEHHISDVDGEDSITALISSVTSTNPITITVHDDQRHNLEDNQEVLLTDINGPTTLNDKTFPVTVTGPFAFTIPVDGTTLPGYQRGGYMKSFKRTGKVKMAMLKDALKQPEAMITDFAKMDMPQNLHSWFQALHQFIQKNNNHPPTPYSKPEAEEILRLTKEINSSYKDAPPLNEQALTKLSYVASGNLNPMAAFLAGFAAQEALKACSGKHSPINQWFYFDAVECLPTPLPAAADASPVNSRYDGQISVFGRSFQDKLCRHKNFVVGAGALGCEFLKNFAMMGMGCSPEGKVVVTDMDSIEKSNLSRQFLFRAQHIGKMKSDIAAIAAKAMNNDLNVVTMTDKVAQETEATFDDSFWEGLDGVTNALDNVQARLYTDGKCVYYRKPLMESGTLGTKGNVQVVVPFKTESYSSSRDPPEKSIPICTLKHFPNAIEHTIQWARDSFEGLFHRSAEDGNAYVYTRDFIPSLDKEPGSKLLTVQTLYDSLVKSRPRTFQDCIGWGRLRFEEFFNHGIQQLLYNFPIDQVTRSGEPFWSGPKRPPAPITFDPTDPIHLQFVMAAAVLRAFNYGIKPETEEASVRAFAGGVQVPAFQPQKTNIQVDENAPKEEVDVVTASRDSGAILSLLPPAAELAAVNFRMIPVEFEKDDDTNYHMAFIAACANLRARNYKIPEADMAKVKQIAGRIIPAMVTTTALVTGLVCMEWYKIIQDDGGAGQVPLDKYKNGFLNIALPFVTLSEPIKMATASYGNDKQFTLWDRFEINLGRDVSLQEFIDYFQKEHQLEISIISAGKSIIYSFFAPKSKLRERLPKPVSEVVKEINKSDFSPKQKYINMEICCTYEGDDCDVPYVRYQFRSFT